jgi:hypothetical protein
MTAEQRKSLVGLIIEHETLAWSQAEPGKPPPVIRRIVRRYTFADLLDSDRAARRRAPATFEV